MVGQYRAVGIDEFIVDAPEPDRFDIVERVASEVLPKIRHPATA